MRLFIAVDIPEELQNKCKEMQGKIAGRGISLARSFHITLKFLGEVPEDKVGEIKERLSKISFHQFEVKAVAVGFFPNIRKPRVIHIRCESDKLYELAKSVSLALPEFPNDHEFVAHITLARIRNKLTRQTLDKIISLKMGAHNFNVSLFELKKSTFDASKVKYETLAEFRGT